MDIFWKTQFIWNTPHHVVLVLPYFRNVQFLIPFGKFIWTTKKQFDSANCPTKNTHNPLPRSQGEPQVFSLDLVAWEPAGYCLARELQLLLLRTLILYLKATWNDRFRLTIPMGDDLYEFVTILVSWWLSWLIDDSSASIDIASVRRAFNFKVYRLDPKKILREWAAI